MNFPSKLVEKAAENLSFLPGIGKKTALRLVFYLLKAILEFILRLSISILIFIKLDFIANFIVNLYQTLRSRIK